MARHHFPTLQRLQELHLPLFVIHSPADRTIEDHHGKALYAAGKTKKQYLDVEGGHNSTWYNDGLKITTAYQEFVNSLQISK